MFQAADLKKVKNVKRDHGSSWAYFNEGEEEKFKLNFSYTQVKGGRELIPGEIILLFQKVDNIPGIRPLTYLTHLVTPIGQPITKNNTLNHQWNWELDVAVIARANPKTAIYSTPALLNFRNPNWGKICDIAMLNFSRRVEDIQGEIWNYFLPFINPELDTLLQSPVVGDIEIINDFGVLEGREFEYVKRHLGRERNSVIVGLAKARAYQKFNGRVLCSCCDFDFYATYGEHGLNFIEAHHIVPIGTGGERITKVEDLELVCANCHRMLHRRIPGTEEYFSVEELRKHIINIKAENK